ncbi:L-rhamnose mutarotase [Novosphingobium sp. CF614]|uniref:L-rhamnose mutarotase n=1 Tax=Novosphingobium sp. CF614 TaxID=1884364 RepID=UPI0008E72D73|nr:L-rhamnose mutarotase [Novosphingobium sp. CF614]SFF73031.1 L-rhamnose mutarotase [Novosphingobium sp. CF614]
MREVFLLDLSDQALAAAYEDWHRPGRVPPQVIADIAGSGVTAMEIYRAGDRLVMVCETGGEATAADRVTSEASAEWERRMDPFQKPLPAAPQGVKWLRADRIFDLTDHIETKDLT